MKRKNFAQGFFTLVFLLFVNISSVFAQDEPTGGGGMRSPIPLAPGHDDRLIFDLTLDNFAVSPSSLEVNIPKSRGINIKLMKDKLIKNSRFSFGYGLGFSSQNFDTDRFIVFDDSLDVTFFVPFDSATDVKRNKLSVNYLDLPLEFRFRTTPNSKNNSFKIAIGFKIGVLLQSHIKYEDGDGKVKFYNIENLYKYRYGVDARIGYGIWGLNAYYSLLPLFDEKKAPEVVPISFGLSITPF
jgi:hypothetical protein